VNARVVRLFEAVPLVCLLLTPDIIGFILLTSDIMKRDSKLDLLQGTLDLLILRTLQTGLLHGWAISERIQQISQDVLQVNQGSLYPGADRPDFKELKPYYEDLVAEYFPAQIDW
jgi:hypothetical protein